MKQIRKPYWLLVAVILPQVALVVIFWSIYNRVYSILDRAALRYWSIFGPLIVFLCIGLTIYGFWSLLKNKEIHFCTGFVILATYLPWLYLLISNLFRMIPPSVPRWLFFGIEPEICLLTLIVPAFCYSILLLVSRFMPEINQYKPGTDFLLTLVIPAFWYIGLRMVFPLFRISFSTVFMHFLLILMIITTVIFLFVFIRLIYGLLLRKKVLFWKLAAPALLTLPTICLIINNRFSFFGNFSGWGFYLLAVLTGILLVIPRAPIKKKYYRLAVFAAKSVTFAYTAYFFLVFLPYLPLSVIAIIGFGLGFLLLVPLAFGIIHAKSLWEDFQFLGEHFHRLYLGLVFFFGFLTLPCFLFSLARLDKQVILTALNYVYRSEYSLNSELQLNLEKLERVIKNIKANKNDGMRFFGMGERTPYLSSAYNWIVLDNLTLSQGKIATLEKIFFNYDVNLPVAGSQQLTSENVVVKDYQTDTRFDEKTGCYRSWVNLELENLNGREEEFVACFRLPSGNFISNYYLYVDGERKEGLIADERVSTWIYEQIVHREKRDPGILYYLSGEEVVLKIFPFLPHEIRKSGFELLHPGPVHLLLAGENIRLVTDREQMFFKEERVIPGAIWVSGQVKELLPLVYRKPQYHFLIDYSSGNKELIETYLSRVSRFLQEHDGGSRRLGERGSNYIAHTVSAVNYEVKTFTIKEDWREKLGEIQPEGGFYLDRAVKAILYDNYITKSACFPLLVVVTDNLNHLRVWDDYTGWRLTFPESDRYYHLRDDGRLHELALLDRTYAGDGVLPEDLLRKPVLAWPDLKTPSAYLPNTGEASFILTEAFFTEKDYHITDVSWQGGLLLEALTLGLTLNPRNYTQEALGIIQSSIRTGIMAPLTSYIVLENEAQEKALMEKQDQILASDQAVDVGEALSLNEPSLPVMILVLLSFLFARRRAQKPPIRPDRKSLI